MIPSRIGNLWRTLRIWCLFDRLTMAEYQETIWHFGFDSKERTPVLQLFASEDSMFREGTARPDEEHRFEIPPSLRVNESTSNRSRDRIWNGDEAQEMARRLWENLPLSVRDTLKARRLKSETSLRVRISSDWPEASDLPWELLLHPVFWIPPGKPWLNLTRSVPVRVSPSPTRVSLPLKMLLVLTNPKDERLLDSHAEINAVTQSLSHESYHWEVCHEPTVEALQDALRRVQPQIVHYIGHSGVGHGEGNLILHDSQDRTRWLDAETVSRALPPTVKLLCLSTCFSARNYQILGLLRFAMASVAATLPSIVVNQSAVSETTVRKFWGAFYHSLIEDAGDASMALSQGHRAAREAQPHLADWASFALVLRERSSIVFEPISQIQELTNVFKEFGDPRVDLQARLAADFANDLAEQVRSLGTDVSPALATQLSVEVDRAQRYEARAKAEREVAASSKTFLQ